MRTTQRLLSLIWWWLHHHPMVRGRRWQDSTGVRQQGAQRVMLSSTFEMADHTFSLYVSTCPSEEWTASNQLLLI